MLGGNDEGEEKNLSCRPSRVIDKCCAMPPRLKNVVC